MIELSLNKRSEQRETISQSIFCAEIKLNEWNIASVHHIQRSYDQEPVLFEREKGQVAIGHYSHIALTFTHCGYLNSQNDTTTLMIDRRIKEE